MAKLRKRRPILGNVTGGLSGPAIKPLALRMVWQVARNVLIPVIGIGGIASVDDAMEFLAAGASAVQLGTVNFYEPGALAVLGAKSVSEIVGTAHSASSKPHGLTPPAPSAS
jgi:dihydroorotate dehydrogenase (NAD+) catalytic subunit